MSSSYGTYMEMFIGKEAKVGDHLASFLSLTVLEETKTFNNSFKT